jgi:hypothetical protein
MTSLRETLRSAVESPAAAEVSAVEAAIDGLASSPDAADLAALVEFFAQAIDLVHAAATPAALERARRWRDRAAVRLARQPGAAADERYRAARQRYERQLTERVPLEEFIALTDGLIVELSDAIAREGAEPPDYPHAALVLATVANWNRLAKAGQLPGAYQPTLGFDRPHAAFGRVAERLRRLDELYVTHFRDRTAEGAPPGG